MEESKFPIFPKLSLALCFDIFKFLNRAELL